MTTTYANYIATLDRKAHYQLCSTVNTLGRWLGNNLKWYYNPYGNMDTRESSPDWDLTRYLETGLITMTLYKKPRAPKAFDETLVFEFPSLEKIKQINSVIKSGEYDKELILKKIVRDYKK